MISASYARTMADYNAVMNTKIYAAAGRLSDEERRRDRGAFWRSIHGTLSHLLWADRMWMSRFDGWEKPPQNLSQSPDLFSDFGAMARARTEDDIKLCRWAEGLADPWFTEDQTWFSGAAQREITASRQTLIVHLFNHQTHHRGQVHALLTAAGEQSGDTDIWLVLDRPTA